MKKISLYLLASILLLAIGTTAHSQFLFSVRPQLLGLDGAAFGYKLPSDLAIFGGVDYMHLGATITVSSSAFSSGSTVEASLSLYNLFAGAKYFVAKSGSAKGYILGEISKPFVKLSATGNGTEDPTIKQLSDNLSIWGIKAGFGGEYFFADEFSLGGEFGLRYFFTSTKTEQTQTYYVPIQNPPYYTTSTSTVTTDLKLNIGLTYTMLTLNYYFR